ncbi:MAG: translation elongation factor Ts [Lachnospiraceae bacterium]|nr:translation elongation factor Ts [Lachnospiraceae bacterium]
MEITAKMVKQLREMTGSGIMDCKRALQEADGDYDRAVEVLREKGLATAQKKAGRIAAEGIVYAVVKEDKAAIVEVNSETDFVAKNEKFRTFVAEVADQILATDAADVDALLATDWIGEDDGKVSDVLANRISVIGENLKIRRFEKLTVSDGVIIPYIHAAGRIGVLVQAQTSVVNDEVTEAVKNVAMQVAALNAKYVSEDEIDQDFIAHEKEILMTAAKNETPDKPEKILNGIVMGRLKKEFKEICLLDQVYVKAEDGKQSVAQYLAQVSKAVGADIKITKFVRFETGEGLAKKEENFAEEVAKQMGN